MTAGGDDVPDDFDEILDQVGNFGWYQKFRYLFVLLLFSTYLGGPPTTNTFLGTFPTTEPFFCNIPKSLPPALQNLSHHDIVQYTINMSSNGCSMVNLNQLAKYMHTNSSWRNYTFNLPTQNCPAGRNFSLQRKTTLITKFDLVCERDYLSDLILTVAGGMLEIFYRQIRLCGKTFQV